MKNKMWAVALLSMLLGFPVVAQQYSDWSAPLNVGAPVNAAGLIETDPVMARDGLSLYFVCNNCPGGYGRADIYVSQRAGADAPWGPPQNLGPAINTPANESGLSLSPDEHRLFFTSDRSGGSGGNDIYVSRRHNRRDDFAWRAPQNLASVNTAASDGWPILFENDVTGEILLYFATDRATPGNDDIYFAVLQPDETFGEAFPVPGLNSTRMDRHPSLSRDGLEIYFMSNRLGSVPNPLGQPSFDIWVSTRQSTSDDWSTPVNGGFLVNTPFHDGRPWLSFNGLELYFFSGRGGGLGPCTGPSGGPPCFFDLWVTTRARLAD